jgi:DNA-binding MarR family transcriptional regulator
MNDPFSALPGYLLIRAANARKSELAGRLAALGVRQVDVSVLMLVEGNPGMTSSKLGVVLDIKRANMAPLLYQLETEGLISREPIDGKSQAIHLTRAGASKLKKARAVVEDFECELINRVPEKSRPHVIPILLALWGEEAHR